MKAAIMQPTYLPWLGYFNMMMEADVFVLLDNVQFAKKSWQQRNRIKSQQGELMLTVPVVSANRFHQLITDTLINIDSQFAKKHVKTIQFSYAKASFADQYISDISQLIESGETHLSQFTESLIRWFAQTLELETRILRGSDLNANGSGTRLTVNQLTELGADVFIAAEGSRPYVGTEPAFAEAGIEVVFQDYQHPEYTQLHGTFISHLSAIDALLNVGAERTRELIQS
jgi:hypothetical protein